jgi:protein-L-isoaspartate O-methyltransferase
MAAFVAAGLVAVALYLFFFVFFPIARGAIYDPSSRVEAEIMARIAEVRQGEKAADLGSGDGRVVCALARAGAEAHGYEINPILVLVSRSNIRREGLGGRAFIHWGNFWRRRLSDYSLITTFQVGFVMARLEAKLTRELVPGSRIVSHYWRFPRLRPEQTQGNIYRYRIGGPSGVAPTSPR